MAGIRPETESFSHRAIQYTLNQQEILVGY
jgi:hypothetical protein